MNKMLSLSLKQHRYHSVADAFKVCCANGFWFGFHLGNFHFNSSSCTFEFMGLLFLMFLNISLQIYS